MNDVYQETKELEEKNLSLNGGRDAESEVGYSNEQRELLDDLERPIIMETTANKLPVMSEWTKAWMTTDELKGLSEPIKTGWKEPTLTPELNEVSPPETTLLKYKELNKTIEECNNRQETTINNEAQMSDLSIFNIMGDTLNYIDGYSLSEQPISHAINHQILNIEKQVIEGNISPIEALIDLKAIDDYIQLVKGNIMNKAIEEKNKYPEKEISKYGYRISISSSGRYSYNHIPQWKQAKERLTIIEDDAKSAYDSAIKGKTQIDQDGEVVGAAEYKPNKVSVKLIKIKDE